MSLYLMRKGGTEYDSRSTDRLTSHGQDVIVLLTTVLSYGGAVLWPIP